MPLQAIENQRLYQQVAGQIRDLIRSGEFTPGHRLPPERDLARQLGVSRPTVREAMIALEIAGLVEIRVGSGSFVTDHQSQASITIDGGPGPFALLAARRMLEGEIAAAAALSADADDLAAIQATLVEFQREADRGDAGRVPDQAFHVRIAMAARNDVLVGLVDQLWGGVYAPVFDAMSVRTGLSVNQRMTLADHTAIFEALVARDPERARSAMHDHLNHVEAVLAGAEDLASSGATPAVTPGGRHVAA